eukprot:SAG31_NODE_42848_length_269_cov_1.900000_1_plen_30_part_10
MLLVAHGSRQTKGRRQQAEADAETEGKERL